MSRHTMTNEEFRLWVEKALRETAHVSEMLEAKIEHLTALVQEQRAGDNRAHAEQHLAEAKALLLDATEQARRLDNLNHAQALAAARDAEYVSREVYEYSQREFRAWQDRVNAELYSKVGRDRGVAIAWAVVLAVATIAVGALAVVLAR